MQAAGGRRDKACDKVPFVPCALSSLQQGVACRGLGLRTEHAQAASIRPTSITNRRLLGAICKLAANIHGYSYMPCIWPPQATCRTGQLAMAQIADFTIKEPKKEADPPSGCWSQLGVANQLVQGCDSRTKQFGKQALEQATTDVGSFSYLGSKLFSGMTVWQTDEKKGGMWHAAWY